MPVPPGAIDRVPGLTAPKIDRPAAALNAARMTAPAPTPQAADRIILALDRPDAASALALVEAIPQLR